MFVKKHVLNYDNSKSRMKTAKKESDRWLKECRKRTWNHQMNVFVRRACACCNSWNKYTTNKQLHLLIVIKKVCTYQFHLSVSCRLIISNFDHFAGVVQSFCHKSTISYRFGISITTFFSQKRWIVYMLHILDVRVL